MSQYVRTKICRKLGIAYGVLRAEFCNANFVNTKLNHGKATWPKFDKEDYRGLLRMPCTGPHILSI